MFIYVYTTILFFICFLVLLNLLQYAQSLLTTLYIFIAYIILSGYYLLYINADLFSGFLWIIDFNLLFIFLLFGIYFLNIFKNNKIYVYNYLLPFKFIYLIFFILCTKSILILNTSLTSVNVTWLISYVNYYILYIDNIKTNIILLYFTYFKINIDLFLVINFILFFSIILSIYLFLNINRLKLNIIYTYYNKKYIIFQKYQNINTQKYKSNIINFF